MLGGLAGGQRGAAASERLCVCNHAEIKAEHHPSSAGKLRQVVKRGEIMMMMDGKGEVIKGSF